MKIKEGFVVRQLADHYVVVPVNTQQTNFHGMIQLNETGAFLWKQFGEETTEEAVVQAVLDTYEITSEKAQEDVEQFIQQLKGAELFCEEH